MATPFRSDAYINGEWRGIPTKTKGIMVVGVLVLVTAFALFGMASKQLAS